MPCTYVKLGRSVSPKSRTVLHSVKYIISLNTLIPPYECVKESDEHVLPYSLFKRMVGGQCSMSIIITHTIPSTT